MIKDSVIRDDSNFQCARYLSAPNRLGSEILDCIVIGAGASGLKCAHTLATADPSRAYKILTLEAQNYIGFPQ